MPHKGICLPWNCHPISDPGSGTDQFEIVALKPCIRIVFCNLTIKKHKAYMTIEGQKIGPIGMAAGVSQALKTFTKGYGMAVMQGTTEKNTKLIGFLKFPNPKNMDNGEDLVHHTLAIYTKRSLEQSFQ